MADIVIYRINYKSDFILTLQSDAGWATPFCIKFWTGAPSQAYYAGWDGTTYINCAVDQDDPLKLHVQFDDHHLPVGDLKFQIGYHFTVADFPTTVEDEVINQAAVILNQDGTPMQVMLDFNGETAPEIEFSLPAYANEAQRIANEQARIEAEQQRIDQEEARITAEDARQQAEQQRIEQEEARVDEFRRLWAQSIDATDAANSAAELAEEKAALADEKAALAQDAATLAQQKAQLADDKAALAAAAAANANEKAALAQQKANDAASAAQVATAAATNATEQAAYAKREGDAAKALNQSVAEAETQRQTNEQERVAAEERRVTDFEAQMQQQQQAYEAAETEREQAYTTAESRRESAFEEAEEERDGKVDEKLADITNLQDMVAFINKSFGKYDGETEMVLTQAKAGKYVNVNGGETTQAGYGISEPIALNAGDILLVPSAQAVPATVSVIARLVDRTYQKVIAYIYTYRTDYPELPATATADYDASLVYTAVYDESGETPTLTGWTHDGETYATLPATREVSEQFYEPLMKQAVAAMPSTGYYIYLCPTAMTVVVSGLTATVDGGTALIVGWGIFKNITTNFVGAPGQSVLAQAFAVLFAAIDGLKAQLGNLGDTRADSIDFGNLPRFCGQPMVIEGAGAPASPIFPTMVGQRYHDTTNKKVYEAFSVTGAISDWVLLN